MTDRWLVVTRRRQHLTHKRRRSVEIVPYNTRSVMVNAAEDKRCASVMDGGWKHLGGAAADISGSDASVAARLAITWAGSLVKMLSECF